MSEQPAILSRFQRYALLAAAVGLVLTVLAIAIQGVDTYLQAYLVAFMYWCGIALGGLGILSMHFLAGGRWGALIRRFLEAGALTLPLMLVLMIPILVALPRLYLWARPEALNIHEIQQKSGYLNMGFFIGRTVVYFVIWSLFAVLMRKYSLREDKNLADNHDTLTTIGAPGLIFYILSVSFAVMDWGMSLEPKWYSTIYGFLFITGQAMTALSVCIFLLRNVMDGAPFSDRLKPREFNDLGNLMLVFVMLSAYSSLSQFLIIWSGNLPDESVWYIRRSNGGWQYLAEILALFHFLIPFLVLLFRAVKRNAGALAKLCVFILIVHVLELYWYIKPAFDEQFTPRIADLAALLLLGGIWFAAYLHILKKESLLAHNAPELVEHQHTEEKVA